MEKPSPRFAWRSIDARIELQEVGLLLMGCRGVGLGGAPVYAGNETPAETTTKEGRRENLPGTTSSRSGGQPNSGFRPAPGQHVGAPHALVGDRVKMSWTENTIS